MRPDRLPRRGSLARAVVVAVVCAAGALGTAVPALAADVDVQRAWDSQDAKRPAAVKRLKRGSAIWRKSGYLTVGPLVRAYRNAASINRKVRAAMVKAEPSSATGAAARKSGIRAIDDIVRSYVLQVRSIKLLAKGLRTRSTATKRRSRSYLRAALRAGRGGDAGAARTNRLLAKAAASAPPAVP